MSGSSICDVCRVRVSHRRQSLDEHKESVHGLTKEGAEKKEKKTSKTAKSEKDTKTKEVKKVEKTTLKRKAEAISSTKKESSTTTKRAKPSPATTPSLPAPPPTPPATANIQPKMTTPVVEKKDADQLIDLSMLDEQEKTPPRQPAPSRLTVKEKEPVVEAVVCPVCSTTIASTSEVAINQHIDECLSMNFLKEEEQAQQARRQEQRPSVVNSSLDDSRGTEEEYEEDDEEEEEDEIDAEMERLLASTVTKPKPTTTLTPQLNRIQQQLQQLQQMQQQQPPQQRLQPSPLTPTLSPSSVPKLELQRQHLKQLTSLIEKQRNSTTAAPSPPIVPMSFAAAAPVVNPVPTPLFRKVEPKGSQQQAPAGGQGHSTVLDRKLDKECSICFEDFVPGTEVCWLECLCVYHTQCISEWFEKRGSRSCPLHSDD